MNQEEKDFDERRKIEINALKLRSDFGDLYMNLALNVQCFEQGYKFTYRIISVILRILFLDQSRKKEPRPLLSRILPDVRFSKIRNDNQIFEAMNVGDLFPTLSFNFLVPDDPTQTPLSKVFEIETREMPASEWLDQNIFGKLTTVRGLILDVANTEGAHADESYSPRQLAIHGATLGLETRARDMGIYFFGKHVLEVLTEIISVDPSAYGLEHKHSQDS